MSDPAATLFLDCAGGVSGDMLAAALLALSGDDGAAHSDAFDAVVAPALAAAGIDPTVVHVAATERGGFAALSFTVDERPGFASFAELTAAVGRAALDDAVRDGVVAVAARLAAAERAVHGRGGEHLHELSNLDTAVDLIAVVSLIRHLAPVRVIAAPPALGAGVVETAHGVLPVPAPAVLELLRGLPTAGDGPAGAGAVEAAGELTTPTGAALLAELADGFGTLPAGRLAAVGVGAGRRELAGRPNVLRAVLVGPLDRSPQPLGVGLWSEDDVELLETTIDDLSGELLAAAAERLFAAGALDVWFTPAVMKKSRPGTVLHALTRPQDEATVAEAIFRETSTFGVRVVPVRRMLLDERHETVEVGGEAVRVRLGFLGGRLVTASPEYEDCRRAAARAGRPLQDVYDAARAAARRAE